MNNATETEEDTAVFCNTIDYYYRSSGRLEMCPSCYWPTLVHRCKRGKRTGDIEFQRLCLNCGELKSSE